MRHVDDSPVEVVQTFRPECTFCGRVLGNNDLPQHLPDTDAEAVFWAIFKGWLGTMTSNGWQLACCADACRVKWLRAVPSVNELNQALGCQKINGGE